MDILLDIKAVLAGSLVDLSPFKNEINQYTIESTIDAIRTNKLSIARFGDGELSIMAKDHGVGFQEKNEHLADRLLEVFLSNNKNLLIGLPDQFSYLHNSKRETRKFWIQFNKKYHAFFKSNLSGNKVYGNTNITRFYMVFHYKKNAKQRFSMLKKIWQDRDVLIVEGEFSRSGVGNELYTNTKSLNRLICPAKNAFNNYNDILNKIKEVGKNKLILMALGPTATVLAYDLSEDDYWCLDLGHLDVEYMWMLNNAKVKTSVQGRYVNESTDKIVGDELSNADLEKYEKQIIAKIGVG